MVSQRERRLQVGQEPPSNPPVVALDLGEPGDWHIRTLIAQILGPGQRLLGVLNPWAEVVRVVVPYCGGCGHLYFNEPKLTLKEAQEKAKTLRCHYCLEERKENAN